MSNIFYQSHRRDVSNVQNCIVQRERGGYAIKLTGFPDEYFETSIWITPFVGDYIGIEGAGSLAIDSAYSVGNSEFFYWLSLRLVDVAFSDNFNNLHPAWSHLRVISTRSGDDVYTFNTEGLLGYA